MSRDPIVTPEGWLHRGEAFVRGDGRQLAVFGGIPGERARVRLVGGHGNQDQAKWVGPAGKPHADLVTQGLNLAWLGQRELVSADA